MEQADIIFQGKREVLDLVSRGDPIVASIGVPDPEKCSLIDSQIKLGKLLGKGAEGTVFDITVPGKGTKQYVIKRGVIKLEDQTTVLGPFTRDKVSGFRNPDLRRIPYEAWVAFNPTVDVTQKGTFRLYVPDFAQMCITDEPESFEASPPYPVEPEKTGKTDDPENKPVKKPARRVEFPKGSYLCNKETYSEYYIGALLGDAYRREECINFFDVYSIFVCTKGAITEPVVEEEEEEEYGDDEEEEEYGSPGSPSAMGERIEKAPKIFHQYIIMDKIEGAYSKYPNCAPLSLRPPKGKKFQKSHPLARAFEEQHKNGVYLQLMFAIAFFQEKYQISHNDLHQDNIFIECVGPDTMFRGKLLADATWFHYRIENRDIYFPAMPIIVKIGDFGFSIKYSEPVVARLEVLNNEFDVVPNHYIPQYDSTFATVRYIQELCTTEGALTPLKGCAGETISDCLKYLIPEMATVKATDRTILTELARRKIIDRNSYRPDFVKLYEQRTAKELLLSDVIAKHYVTKKPKGKIVTLGEL